MKVFLQLCVSVLLLAVTDAAIELPEKLKLEDLTKAFEGLKPDLSVDKGGKVSKFQKKGICGDGMTDLSTEECDEGAENGQPGSFCLANCTYVSEVKCSALLINTTAALEEAQICRTATKVEFALQETVDVELPNLTIVTGDFETQNGETTQMRSLTMPNLIAVAGDVSFTDSSAPEMLFADFPSLLFATTVEFESESGGPTPMKIERVSFPSLISVVRDLQLQRLPQLHTAVFDSLEFVEDDIDVNDCPLLKSLHFPKLIYAGDINIERNERMTKVEFPSLYALRSDFEIDDMPSLQTVSAPVLTLGGTVPGWQVFAPVLGPSGFTFILCSLPAFEENYLRSNQCANDLCTVEGTLSDACASEKKGNDEPPGKAKEGGIFGLEGLKGKGVDLSGLLSFDKRGLGISSEKGVNKDKTEKKVKDECPEYYPEELKGKGKKPPVCGNGIVEVGEECDGDARVCDNSACVFLTGGSSGVCDLGDSARFNSTAEFESLLDCAIIIVNSLGLDIGVPPNFHLPLLEAFYGSINAVSGSGFNPVVEFSFPRARYVPSIGFGQISETKDLEIVDFPCARQSGTLNIGSAPRFRKWNVPRVEVMQQLRLRLTGDSSTPFDISMPEAVVVRNMNVQDTAGLQRILLPEAVFIDSGTTAIGNTDLEVFSVPKMSQSLDTDITLQNNPKLTLFDNSGRLFTPAEITVKANAVDGINLLFCSLNAFQKNMIEAANPPNSCSTSDSPPCSLIGGGDKGCASVKKGNKGGEGEEEKGGKLFDFEGIDLMGLLKG
uniref:Uncharacterized protein n=1 Tax=Chromera velia CCMP2878 TaxID=1169474 RepID=A0A0G4I412_9ALVE|eukprot:Cvel_10735.t1-p1 / transcript=Cvel_10735.t1 / gene=Cvel_10735 / organism=Chromera_velia_CCMP2878 / gene_product=hypothetical protein / transcript_product=hypothetical protein / location=Cvel_scaffold654:50643-54352(-) / protein_length=779 / sequence_SO=supercontig / SO=protein_coding / is_pseudo=false